MIIKIVPYDPNWPSAFQSEATKISQVLSTLEHTSHHIGSTSVPGLAAKPIIDMLLEVSSLSDLDQKSGALEGLGYEAMGEYGIPGRRYFRKGGDQRTHHIHAFTSGDVNLVRHLAFRDYLIAHTEIAAKYGALKMRIAQEWPHDLAKYCDAKDPFVQQHERLALAWYSAQKGHARP